MCVFVISRFGSASPCRPRCLEATSMETQQLLIPGVWWDTLSPGVTLTRAEALPQWQVWKRGPLFDEDWTGCWHCSDRTMWCVHGLNTDFGLKNPQSVIMASLLSYSNCFHSRFLLTEGVCGWFIPHIIDSNDIIALIYTKILRGSANKHILKFIPGHRS